MQFARRAQYSCMSLLITHIYLYYQGVTKNGNEVAVKILKDNSARANHHFQNEFHHLRMLKHPNIVRVLGYCYETKKTPVRCNGQTVHAERTYRALCFEYLQNGSLQKHICGMLVENFSISKKNVLHISSD